jgi:hypothetical protein
VRGSERFVGGGVVGWVFAWTAIGGGGKRLAKLAGLLAFAFCLAPPPQRTAEAPGRETSGRSSRASRHVTAACGLLVHGRRARARRTGAAEGAARRAGGVGAAARVLAAMGNLVDDAAAAAAAAAAAR